MERVICVLHARGMLGPNRHMCKDTLCLGSDHLGQSCVDYGPVSLYDWMACLPGSDTGMVELESYEVHSQS